MSPGSSRPALTKSFTGDRPPRAPQVVPRSLKYRETQEHLVRRLGAAVVLQWDELSDEMQDLLIDQAVVVEDGEPSDSREIESFIRSVKTTALSKPADEQAPRDE